MTLHQLLVGFPSSCAWEDHRAFCQVSHKPWFKPCLGGYVPGRHDTVWSWSSTQGRASSEEQKINLVLDTQTIKLHGDIHELARLQA